MAQTKISRSDLVDRLAFERAEYELRYESYGPDALQPYIPFIKAETFRLAKIHGVERVTVTPSEYGTTYYARIDWKRLAADVECRTARFKRDIVELGEPS